MLLLFALCLLSTSLAEDIYVAPDANSTDANGSFDFPFPDWETALLYANSSDVTIIMKPGIYGSQNASIVYMDVTIQSMEGSAATIIDCQGAATYLEISNSTVTLEGVQFINCSGGFPDPNSIALVGNSTAWLRDIVVSDCRSAILGFLNVEWGSTAILYNTTFRNNAPLDGQPFPTPVILSQGHIVINNSLFDSNTNNISATYYNGFIYASSSVVIVNSTFMNNRATRGGIYIDAGVGLTVSDSTFTNNVATWGGAFYLFTLSAEFTRCNFVKNEAKNSGGAVYCPNDAAQISFSESLFDSNFAVVNGGALSLNVTQNIPLLSDVIFNNNQALSGTGGAAYINHWVPVVPISIFPIMGQVSWIQNQADLSGGALSINLYSKSMIPYSLDGNNFQGNSAPLGGAVFVNAYFPSASMPRSFQVSNSNFTMNQGVGGAAMAITNAICMVKSTSFSWNSALENGGAILSDSSSLSLDSVSFHMNQASGNGQEIYCLNSQLSLDDVVLDASTNGSQVYCSACSYEGSLLNKGNSDNCVADPQPPPPFNYWGLSQAEFIAVIVAIVVGFGLFVGLAVWIIRKKRKEGYESF